MDTITERFVDSVDGVRIAVYEQGNPDGPTVVLVHGWPDSHVLWDGVVAAAGRPVPDHPLTTTAAWVNRLCPNRFRPTPWRSLPTTSRR